MILILLLGGVPRKIYRKLDSRQIDRAPDGPI